MPIRPLTVRPPEPRQRPSVRLCRAVCLALLLGNQEFLVWYLRRRAPRRRFVRYLGMRSRSGVQERIHGRRLPGSASGGRRHMHIRYLLPGVLELRGRQRYRCNKDRRLHDHGIVAGRSLRRHQSGLRRQPWACVLGSERSQNLPASRVRSAACGLWHSSRWFSRRVHQRRLLHAHRSRRCRDVRYPGPRRSPV
jgi:hypothetical protein